MSAFSEYKIAFMGQTRRGKSSLLNALFGTSFKIETIVECTTNINSATFYCPTLLPDYDAITVMDTPGIGASLESSESYNPYYKHVLAVADCVVWVTNMQRTDKLDQEFFNSFRDAIRKELNLIVCINGIDKFSPHTGEEVWDVEHNRPCQILYKAIEDRKKFFREKFSGKIPINYEFVCTNALNGYGIDDLKTKILAYGK